jgi:Domain of unknown function (DUF3943)
MKRVILLFTFLLIFFYQTPVLGQVEIYKMADTLPKHTLKRPWAAAVENLGINVLINRYDANIRNIWWAKVSPASWKVNLKAGFQRDYDHFTTNWLGHPTNGSWFYNAARSNGYNYWQSIPFTVGGSLVWEYFGETYNASEIDLFTTSFGGIYLGEMTHRFSEAIRYKVKNRVLKHTLMSLLNPAAQLNSLFFKDYLRPYDSTLNPLIRTHIAFGGSYPFGHIGENPFGARGYLGVSLVYGELFKDNKKHYKPFDFFIFKTWAHYSIRGKDSVFFNISSQAPLLVKHLSKDALISLSQHYDNMASDVYKIGSLAVTGDYSFRHTWHPRNSIIGSVRAGLILFGSSKSDIVKFIYHSDDPEFQRDYVYGKGITGEIDVLFRTEKFGRLTGTFNRWLIFTDRDTKGVEDLMLLIVDYTYPIWRKLNLGVQVNYYKRLARYDNYPAFQHINVGYYDIKTLVGFTF